MTHVSDWAGGWGPIHVRSDRAWHTLPSVPVLPSQRGRPGRAATMWCHMLGHDLVRIDTIETCRFCGRTRRELAPGPHGRLRETFSSSVIDLRSTSSPLDTVDLEHAMNVHSSGLSS